MTNGSERSGTSARTTAEAVLLDVVVPRLAALEASQNAMNGALGLMLDTLQAQTNLLRKLNEYATEDATPSPVAKFLSELISAIEDLDASIGSMEEKFAKLTDIIAEVYGTDSAGIKPPNVNGSGT